MHSSAVLASLLFAVAYAAPAPVPSASSSSHSSAPSYTADAALQPSASSVTVSYTPDAPYKPTASSKTASSAAATANYAGKPTSTGKVDASYDAAFPAVVKYNTRSGDQDLITKLLIAPLQGDRARLLNQPGDFVFDFNDSPEGSESNGRGGRTVAANAKTFPALIGNNAAMTLGFMKACSMNSPHVHPRGTELNVIVEGRLVTNFIQENGVSFQANTLSKYQMTVFPQGAMHQEFNPDCEDAVFVAGFNTADPGVEQIAQSFFGLRSDVISATLGGVQNIEGADLESFRDHIPANVALGVEQCLQKCGIKKNAKRDLSEILGA